MPPIFMGVMFLKNAMKGLALEGAGCGFGCGEGSGVGFGAGPGFGVGPGCGAAA